MQKGRQFADDLVLFRANNNGLNLSACARGCTRPEPRFNRLPGSELPVLRVVYPGAV